MPVLFITRHPGAAAWAGAHLPAAQLRQTLDLGEVQPGDQVCGVIPLDLAAAACARGARVAALVFDRTGMDRDEELSRAHLEARGARLVEYRVVEVPPAPTP